MNIKDRRTLQALKEKYGANILKENINVKLGIRTLRTLGIKRSHTLVH